MHTTTRLAFPFALLLTGALLSPLGCSAGAGEATGSSGSAVTSGTIYFSTDHTMLFGEGFPAYMFIDIGEMDENLDPLAYRNVSLETFTNADGTFAFSMRPTSLPCGAELLFRAFPDQTSWGGGSGSGSGSSSSGSSGSSSGSPSPGDTPIITATAISNYVGYYNSCRILHF